MKFKDIQKQFTDVKIPTVWEKATRVEKTAEILVYNMMFQCMENFMDVSVELASEDPVAAVLRSWTRDREVGFGTNAISLNEREDGFLVLGCIYDINKLKEDVEIMNGSMFGTFDPNSVGEGVIDHNIEFEDNELDGLFGGIQKKKIPLKQSKKNNNET